MKEYAGTSHDNTWSVAASTGWYPTLRQARVKPCSTTLKSSYMMLRLARVCILVEGSGEASLQVSCVSAGKSAKAYSQPQCM